MSEIQYSPDKPKDCKYCYWHQKRSGCSFGEHCYYEIKHRKKSSPCDGCPYGAARPCIGYCMKEVIESVKRKETAK